MHSNFLHLSLSFGNFRMVLYWISDDFECFLDFNEPNFVRLVLEAQKELAKILWNLDAEGIDALALAWRPSTVSRKPPNYALKEGRNRVTNVRIWSKLRWGRSHGKHFPDWEVDFPLREMSFKMHRDIIFNKQYLESTYFAMGSRLPNLGSVCHLYFDGTVVRSPFCIFENNNQVSVSV